MYKNTRDSGHGITMRVFREWIRIHFFAGHLNATLQCESILDLCCGWGFYLKVNPKAHGVDIDPVRIEYLRARGFNVTQCDVAQMLPFADATFDMVLAHDALEHFTYRHAGDIFKHVHRVLKNNGEFMIVLPNRKGYHFHGGKIGHKHFFNYEEIVRLGQELFLVSKPLAYPFPRAIGKYFLHNKEIFVLKKV